MTQTVDLEQVIARAVEALVRAIDPEQIILFGSAARGEFGPDSDLDLLLVVDEGTFSSETHARAREALRHLGVPKDLLYTFPALLDARRHVVGTLEEVAAREGRVLYQRF